MKSTREERAEHQAARAPYLKTLLVALVFGDKDSFAAEEPRNRLLLASMGLSRERYAGVLQKLAREIKPRGGPEVGTETFFALESARAGALALLDVPSSVRNKLKAPKDEEKRERHIVVPPQDIVPGLFKVDFQGQGDGNRQRSCLRYADEWGEHPARHSSFANPEKIHEVRALIRAAERIWQRAERKATRAQKRVAKKWRAQAWLGSSGFSRSESKSLCLFRKLLEAERLREEIR